MTFSFTNARQGETSKSHSVAKILVISTLTSFGALALVSALY